MSKYKIDTQLLLNESDVEQKVVLPLLKSDEPEGLGFNETHIHTKMNLRKLQIEKRKKARLYYPDYLIIINGIPLITIEVKKPNDNLNEAFREARLYSHEINALHKEDLNPCKLIIATDGLRIIAGTWDSVTPKIDVDIDNCVSANENFSNFIEMFSYRKIKKTADETLKKLRTKVTFIKPTHLLGGKHIQNQLTKNSFGETISIKHRCLFNPSNEFERTNIVRNAYIEVQKHMSHVTPIDRLIRKKIRPSIQDSIEINDVTVREEMLDKLKVAQDYNNEVLLLIGSVGSGKSTFTTYLKEVALSEELTRNIVWVRLDLNSAPVNSSEIYLWLKEQIFKELKQTQPNYDAEKMESIIDIFKDDINAFNKIALNIFDSDSEKYKEKLFDEVQKLINDTNKKLKAYIDFYVHRKSKNLIIILDNCDKRNLEEQLLMFEVASWLKENTKSIVFLPLRETTFDHFKHNKPLDTVIKDLTFRINPPSLEKVLYKRIKYATRLNNKSESKRFNLPNGMVVNYPSNDELAYLKSILNSLFQNNFFKKLIIGLAGSNIRKGIEVFLDFCKSGHISERDILQMKQSEGKHSLPNHIISRVFIRGNRLYYSDSDTKVKNLFYSDPNDKLPDPFTRVAILNWLKLRNREKGPSGIIGFHKVSNIIKDLTILGHSLERLDSELSTLIKYSLIISESQDSSKIEYDELVSINPSGLTHLELLDNINYLSACAEDVWYKNNEIARDISERISGKSEYSHLSLKNTLYNATDLVNYLEDYSNEHFSVQKEVLSNNNYSTPIEFDIVKNTIEHFKNKISFKNYREFAIGAKISSAVVNISDSGLICELDGTNQVGWLHISNLAKDISDYDIGDSLEVEIKCYNTEHKKYELKLHNT